MPANLNLFVCASYWKFFKRLVRFFCSQLTNASLGVSIFVFELQYFNWGRFFCFGFVGFFFASNGFTLRSTRARKIILQTCIDLVVTRFLSLHLRVYISFFLHRRVEKIRKFNTCVVSFKKIKQLVRIEKARENKCSFSKLQIVQILKYHIYVSLLFQFQYFFLF